MNKTKVGCVMCGKEFKRKINSIQPKLSCSKQCAKRYNLLYHRLKARFYRGGDV